MRLGKASGSFLKKSTKKLLLCSLSWPFRFSVATLVVAFATTACAQDITGAQPTLPKQHLTITGKSGAHHDFMVEVATTPREQEVGEMFRTDIPADSGMFFDWGSPRDVPMWMKNCPVPEDMVFIGQDGTITHIAENTVPESLTNIEPGGPARATLELQGRADGQAGYFGR